MIQKYKVRTFNWTDHQYNALQQCNFIVDFQGPFLYNLGGLSNSMCADKHEVAGIWAVLYFNSADNILDGHQIDTLDARINQYCLNFGGRMHKPWKSCNENISMVSKLLLTKLWRMHRKSRGYDCAFFQSSTWLSKLITKKMLGTRVQLTIVPEIGTNLY